MSFKKVFQKYWAFAMSQKRYYWTAMFFLVLYAVSSRYVPYLFGEIITQVESQQFEMALYVLVAMLVVKLVSELLSLLKNRYGDLFMNKALIANAKLKYLESLQNADYEYHTNKSSGSLISLAKRGDGALFTAYVEINDQSLVILLEFAISLLLIAQINLTAAGLLAVTLLISAAVFNVLIRMNISRRKDVNAVDDEITGIIVDNMIGFETVKIFAKELLEKSRLAKKLESWVDVQWKYILTFQYIDLSLGLISTAGLAVVLGYAFTEVQSGRILIGDFVAIAFLVTDIFSRLVTIVFKARNLAKVYTDLSSFFAIMDIKPLIKDKPGALKLEQVSGNIHFDNVTFSYHKGQEVLNNINLTIEPDQKVALVGKSGNGKTTLTKLLLRFYDVTGGRITLDGHDIRDLQISSLRNSIGLVPQEVVLFNDTLAYNLAYGKPDATQAEIEVAAEKANLHEFITTLEDGYDTIVGERGIKLSGGQKQRLAIARLILEDPVIVIFDEATSQLDSENEKKIQQAFANLTRQKTTIIIAHRLSTIMDADTIVVFDKGNIVQQGKHEDLLEEGGIYKQLWQLQTEVITQ